MLYLIPVLLMLLTFLYTFKKVDKEEISEMASTRERLLQEKEILSKLNKDS